MSDTNTDDDSFISKLFTSGGILVVGLGIQLVFNFFSKLVIARFFGKVDYGSVSLGIVLLNTVSVIVLVGIDTGIGRYLPRHDAPERRRGILVSAFQIVLPLATIVGLAITVFAEPIARYVFTDPSITPVIRVFGLAVPLAALVKLTVGSIRGMQKALPRVYLQNLSLPLTRFGLVAVAVIVSLGPIGIAWAYVVSYALVAALALYYLVRHTSLFERIESVPMRRELFVFSAPLMIMTMMNSILGNFDTFMIGFFQSTGDVGIYQVAYPLSALLSVVLRAFAFIFLPMASELHSEGDYEGLRRNYRVVTKWIFFVTLPLLFVMAFFPRLVIRNSFGPEYVTGGFVLSILAVGYFTNAVSGLAGDTLIASGRSRLIMYDQLAAAGVNVVLNLILIPRYSLVGAAVATTLSYGLMNVLYLFQQYRIVGTHPFTGSLLKPSIAAVVLWIPYYWGLETYLSVTVPVLVVAMLAYLVLYLVVILQFGGIEREELVLLRQFEDRLGVDLGPIRSIVRRFVR